MPTQHATRYTAVAIALHWILALLIGGMIWLGWNMEPEGGDKIVWMFQLHKSIGITVLILTVARILWRVKNPEPELPSDITPPERFASAAVQFGFYGLMLAMPLTGWLVVSTSTSGVATVLFGQISWPHIPFVKSLIGHTGHEIMEFVHSKLAWVLIALLALHVAGALKHEFSGEEGVLKRMLPGLFGKTSPPRAPSRGFFTAFGGAALLFALIASSPIVANALGAKPAETVALETANWTVDYEASSITFSGDNDGDSFTGIFEDWDASIAFDADNLNTSKVSVTVNTGSARTGNKLNDDTLKAGEWFNTGAFPAATVTLSNIRHDEETFYKRGTGYIADAELTIKELSVTLPLRFWLVIEDGTAEMGGRATLSRAAFDLGQVSDADGDWVSDEINVGITIMATQAEAHDDGDNHSH